MHTGLSGKIPSCDSHRIFDIFICQFINSFINDLIISALHSYKNCKGEERNSFCNLWRLHWQICLYFTHILTFQPYLSNWKIKEAVYKPRGQNFVQFWSSSHIDVIINTSLKILGAGCEQSMILRIFYALKNTNSSIP